MTTNFLREKIDALASLPTHRQITAARDMLISINMSLYSNPEVRFDKDTPIQLMILGPQLLAHALSISSQDKGYQELIDSGLHIVVSLISGGIELTAEQIAAQSATLAHLREREGFNNTQCAIPLTIVPASLYYPGDIKRLKQLLRTSVRVHNATFPSFHQHVYTIAHPNFINSMWGRRVISIFSLIAGLHYDIVENAFDALKKGVDELMGTKMLDHELPINYYRVG